MLFQFDDMTRTFDLPLPDQFGYRYETIQAAPSGDLALLFLLFGELEPVTDLQVHPQLWRCAKDLSQLTRCLRRDALDAPDDILELRQISLYGAVLHLGVDCCRPGSSGGIGLYEKICRFPQECKRGAVP